MSTYPVNECQREHPMFDASQFTASSPLPRFSAGVNPRPRASSATVLVALSSPLVAAGLTAILRRLEGCEVRLWDALSKASAFAGAVVVVDDLALAAQFCACTAASGESIRMAAPKVVVLTNGTKQVNPASIGCVSAWLSIDCPEEQLLGAVQGLLLDAPPATWTPPAGTEFGSRCAQPSARGAPRGRPTGGLAPSALRRVRDHIEARFAQKVDLSRLARIAGLSTSHFSRAFKQSIGMPPHRYVMMRRLAAAAELIRKTPKPLAEVAIELGFSDQSHLTRIFTQMTGETPRAFRRRYR
jgi:AraC-like DNA-binding protein